jgi:hypothetical protein
MDLDSCHQAIIIIHSSFIPSLSLNSRTLTLSALLHLPVFALFLHSAAAV